MPVAEDGVGRAPRKHRNTNPQAYHVTGWGVGTNNDPNAFSPPCFYELEGRFCSAETGTLAALSDYTDKGSTLSARIRRHSAAFNRASAKDIFGERPKFHSSFATTGLEAKIHALLPLGPTCRYRPRAVSVPTRFFDFRNTHDS